MKKLDLSSILVAAVLLTVAVVAQAQQAAKTPRIGMLLANSVSASAARVQAMQQGLRELGYVEGKNIVMDFKYADGKTDQFSKLAHALVDTLRVRGTPPPHPQPPRPERGARGPLPGRFPARRL